MTRHLLIIGAQRCGTTLLYELLDAHPSISMAKPRRPEPKVFLSDELAGRGIDWYHATYFGDATDESVYGEKSTSYIEDSTAPQRALNMLGAAEIVVQLRNPVARAISNWRFSSDHGLEERSVEQALVENLQGTRHWDPRGSSVSPFAYLERGRYADFLGPWLEAFPESMHVQFLEDDPNDPQQLAALFAALRVSPVPQPSHPGRTENESRGLAPDVSPELVTRLCEYFAESDEKLSRLIGRPVPWAAAETTTGSLL